MWKAPSIELPSVSGEPVRRVLAGLPRRLLALAIDALLQSVVLGAVALVAGLLTRALPPEQTVLGAPLRSALLGAVVLALAAVVIGWPVIFEARWRGLTPGKRAAGLRVIDRAGGAPTLSQVLVRNLLRVADLFPGAGLVGLCLVTVDPRARRLGDMVAGTLVVLDAPPLLDPLPPQVSSRALAAALLERWDRLEEGHRVRLAAALAEHFRERGEDPDISDREVLRRATAESVSRR